MKKIIIATILLLTSTSALAEWTYVESISIGRAEMNIVDFTTFAGFVTKKVNTVNYSTLNLALTAVREKIYITINTELPLSDKSYQFSESGGKTVRTVEREDLGLTLGYNIRKGVNLFGGWSYGANHYINISEDDPSVADIKEIDSGPFFGIAYSHELKRYGNLSASLAYALLDGEIKSNDPTNIFLSNTGDTKGFSIKVTYSNKYNNESDYFIAIKIKNYEYDNVSSGGVPVNIVKEKNFFLISGGITIF